MTYNVEVRDLRSRITELEDAVRYKEDVIAELQQTVAVCGSENNSLRSHLLFLIAIVIVVIVDHLRRRDVYNFGHVRLCLSDNKFGKS